MHFNICSSADIGDSLTISITKGNTWPAVIGSFCTTDKRLSLKFSKDCSCQIDVKDGLHTIHLTGHDNSTPVRPEPVKTQESLKTAVKTLRLQKSIFQNAFTCSVCLKLVKNPTSVPCGHTFCFDCLISNFQKRS